MRIPEFLRWKKMVEVVSGRVRARRSYGEIRKGMWVVSKGNVGIVQTSNEEGIVGIMLVQEDGTNLVVVQALRQNLRQAKLDEIPKLRRPEKDLGASLGYF